MLAAVSLCISSLLLFAALPDSKWAFAPVGLLDNVWPETRRMPLATPPMPLLKRVACTGPRGRLLSQSPDDELRSAKLDIRKSCLPPLLGGAAVGGSALTPPCDAQPTQRPSSGRTASSASTNRG